MMRTGMTPKRIEISGKKIDKRFSVVIDGIECPLQGECFRCLAILALLRGVDDGWVESDQLSNFPGLISRNLFRVRKQLFKSLPRKYRNWPVTITDNRRNYRFEVDPGIIYIDESLLNYDDHRVVALAKSYFRNFKIKHA
jgi:hypothetical protein